MFERMTDRARAAIMLAQEEARHLSHNYIGTEHLLLGLIAHDEHRGSGVVATALGAVDLAAARGAVAQVVGEGPHAISGHLPFTPNAKRVLELALRESLQLGHDYIGTEHLLLALLAMDDDAVARQVLESLGVDLVQVREGVLSVVPHEEGGSRPRGGLRAGGSVDVASSGRIEALLSEILGRLEMIERRLDEL